MDAPTEQRSKEEYLLLYAATRRAMDRVELDNNERRLMGVILDCSYGWGKPWMRCSGNRDLKTLTGIDLKNQPRSLRSLEGKLMLQIRRTPWEKTNPDGDLILEPLPDTRLWVFNQGARRIDARVYYACLAGLRVLNGCSPLECTQEEIWREEPTLSEVRAEVSREDAVLEARSNLPRRGEAAKTIAADPLHQIRPGAQVAAPRSDGHRDLANAKTQTDVGGDAKSPLTFSQLSQMVIRGEVTEEQAAAIYAAHPEITDNPSTYGKYLDGRMPVPNANEPDQVLTVSTKTAFHEPNRTHGKYLEAETLPEQLRAQSSGGKGGRPVPVTRTVPVQLPRTAKTVPSTVLNRERELELVSRLIAIVGEKDWQGWQNDWLPNYIRRDPNLFERVLADLECELKERPKIKPNDPIRTPGAWLKSMYWKIKAGKPVSPQSV